MLIESLITYASYMVDNSSVGSYQCLCQLTNYESIVIFVVTVIVWEFLKYMWANVYKGLKAKD
jgi:hypothetical protein